MGRLRRFVRFLKPYSPLIALAILASTAASLADGFTFALIIPFLRSLFGETALPASGTSVERVLDWLVGPLLTGGSPRIAIRNVVFVILGAVAVKNLLAYGAGYASVLVREGLVRDLRVRAYGHLFTQNLRFFQNVKVGHLVGKMLADAEHSRVVVIALLSRLLQNVTLIGVYLAVLLSLSWSLTLLSMISAPVLLMSIRPVLLRLRSRARQMVEHRGELSGTMTEAIGAMRLVKAHGAEAHEVDRLVADANRYRKGTIRAERLALLAQPLSETFGAMVTVVVLWVGTSMAMGESTTLRPETLVAFLAVTLRLMSPIKSLSYLPGQIETGLAAFERVDEILKRAPEEIDRPHERAVDRFEREIRFDRVWFAYETSETLDVEGGPRWVLADVSFDLRQGDIIALVGPSGVGKSTLADLLPRFIEPQRGRITLDGHDLHTIRRSSLRALMGIVSQETVILNDTVAANVVYGMRGTPSRDRMEAAADAANAHDFIARLPAGYNTILGERGTRLSGGQRQRIAIARALYRDPPILVLDEATSALDTEAERQVQSAIHRLLKGRTVLVIAHRLSTIQHATQILVLDRGRVVERGRHDELLKRDGAYARTHAMQFGVPTAR